MAKVLRLRQTTVVRLFEALGFKTAKTWDKERLLKKVKQLPELVDGVNIKNPKTKAILEKILEAKNVGIRMTETNKESEQPSEAATKKTEGEKGEGKKEKTVTKKKAKKEKVDRKKVEKKTTETSEKDAFGRRLGTQGALIDTMLSKKGKSVETIAKETKLSTQRISTHLKDLVKKEFVKVNKDGMYSIV